MITLQPESTAGQATDPQVNTHRGPDAPATTGGYRDRTKPGGFMIATDDFLDQRTEPEASRLTKVEKHLFQNIELFAFKGACFAFPSNETLAKRSRSSVRAVQYLLDSIQRKGWLLSVMKAEGRPIRLCFLLLKRSNKDRPVFDPDRDDLAQIMGVIFARRGLPKVAYRLKNGSAMGEENFTHHGRRKLQAPWVKKTSPESESLSSNQRNPKEDSGGEIPPPSRQRPEAGSEPTPKAEAIPTAEPIAEPVATAAPEGIPLEELSEGQRQFLEELTPDQRYNFDALAIEERREILKPHAIYFDRIIRDHQLARHQLYTPKPQAPPEPPPADTAELIRGLPQGDPLWPQIAAEDLARQFGEKKDRDLWGELHRIMVGVSNGRIEAEAVIDAYEQGRRPECKKPGAVFWTAFKRNTGLDSKSLKMLAEGRAS